MMKKFLLLTFLFTAFKASAQTSVPGQYADKYVGRVISAYGYVYKIDRDPKTKTFAIYFGSKYLEKGVILKMTNDSKLDVGTGFKDMPGHFITVTGKVIKEKGKIYIDGDDPATNIYFAHQPIALN